MIIFSCLKCIGGSRYIPGSGGGAGGGAASDPFTGIVFRHGCFLQEMKYNHPYNYWIIFNLCVMRPCTILSDVLVSSGGSRYQPGGGGARGGRASFESGGGADPFTGDVIDEECI